MERVGRFLYDILYETRIDRNILRDDAYAGRRGEMPAIFKVTKKTQGGYTKEEVAVSGI